MKYQITVMNTDDVLVVLDNESTFVGRQEECRHQVRAKLTSIGKLNNPFQLRVVLMTILLVYEFWN